MPEEISLKEIINYKGKRRLVSLMNIKDKFISKLVLRILEKYITPCFSKKSFAYQKGKGTTQAIIKIKQYVENGNLLVGKIDIKDYFKNINHELLFTILKDFNIRCKSGKIYLLQGRSGEGKSNLLKLLYKELTNYEGNIWIDNIEYRQIKGNTDFFKLFGIASSDSKLFNSTIAENLLFAKPNATENELINSCKMALLYDDIMKMKDGFNTKIGENGNQLSGGQRERLVIARIFLKENVKVYILDEALAEISITNETQILNNLKDVNKNSIIIIVSHRLLNWEYAENVRI